MEKFKIEGRYYIIHSIANGIIVYNSFQGTIDSYKIIPMINNIELKDYIVTEQQIELKYYIDICRTIIYSLHIYHIIWYFKKLRFDDWLHHILMVGVALPLTIYIPPSNITLHSFFFINGLPGCIDYFLLFLNRNNIISTYFEKRINCLLNLWIRCPGCIMNITLIIVTMIRLYDTLSLYNIIALYIIIITIYWNGIYFMNQIVVDYNMCREVPNLRRSLKRVS